ncbi:hypothetical protein [Malonomonas rubra]|uniref:hypothetical protein n=1 Tax=Malonomonas rubra TaxID=57040 RepID=UPI0026F1AC24|nr:hypothetical protein [Malonomonas rubra]
MTYQKNNEPGKIGRVADRPDPVRYLSILVRSLHQIAVALFIGSFLFNDNDRITGTFLIFVASSGLLLLALEGLRHRQFYREFFGLITFIKFVIIGFSYHHLLPPTPALMFVYFIAATISHAPKRIRHRLIF